jgi:predicted AAA+ superfamily ATPase
MIMRRVMRLVREGLDRQGAVGLIGPRQVGKTTLARTLGEATGALYLDLEAPEDRAKLAEPALFLVLGSAAIDLLRQSGETLAGRIACVDMGPFDVIEAGTTEPDPRSYHRGLTVCSRRRFAAMSTVPSVDCGA